MHMYTDMEQTTNAKRFHWKSVCPWPRMAQSISAVIKSLTKYLLGPQIFWFSSSFPKKSSPGLDCSKI